MAAATTEYKRLWRSQGRRIVEQFTAATSLRFAEGTIDALVFEGVSRSEPLQLRASYDEPTKLGTLIHELSHRLIADNRSRLRSPPASSSEEHQLIDLFLFDVWTDLFGESFARHQVEVESKRGQLYRDAWSAALALDRDARESKLHAALGSGI